MGMEFLEIGDPNQRAAELQFLADKVLSGEVVSEQENRMAEAFLSMAADLLVHSSDQLH